METLANGKNGSNPVPTDAPASENPLLKTRWSQYDRWLRPEYVGDQPFELTIRDITYEDGHLQGRPVKTLALHFVEVTNIMALSSINQRALAGQFGNVLGNAVGKKIAIQKTHTKVGRDWKYPLRILSAVPAVVGPAPEEPHYEPLVETLDADEQTELAAEEIE